MSGILIRLSTGLSIDKAGGAFISSNQGFNVSSTIISNPNNSKECEFCSEINGKLIKVRTTIFSIFLHKFLKLRF